MGPILTKNRVQKEVHFCHQGGFRTLNHVFQFSHLQKMSNLWKINISTSQTSPSVKTSKTPSKNGESQNSRFQVFWLSGVKMGYFLKVPLCSRILETTYKTYRRVLKRSLFEKGVCGFWDLLGPKRTFTSMTINKDFLKMTWKVQKWGFSDAQKHQKMTLFAQNIQKMCTPKKSFFTFDT